MLSKQLNNAKSELKQTVFWDRVIKIDPLLQMLSGIYSEKQLQANYFLKRM